MDGGRAGYRILDAGLPVAGLALLVAGVTVAPAALTLAWLALGLSLFRWVAEADGLPWLRPGRAPIQPVGCWSVPLAFTVRHRGETLLFARAEDSGEGGWSNAYTVYEGPRGAQATWEWPVTGGGWARRGRAPVEELRFERHERVCYVDRRSLARAVAQARA